MTGAGKPLDTPPPLAEAAASWDRRLRSADCSEADRKAFEAWCALDPAHATAFDDLQLGIRSLKDAYADNPRLRAMRDNARALRPTLEPWKVAAGLAVVLLGGGAMTGWLTSRPAAPPTTPHLEASRDTVSVYQTAVGERTTVVLSDGSKVTLNTRSKLVVGYTPGRRDVSLVSGQALFEVAKNANRPFVVTAGSRKVTAVGTAFDVKVDSRTVDVTLIEGKVRVDPSRPSLIQKIHTDVRRLVPGEQLVASNTSTAVTGQIRQRGDRDQLATGGGDLQRHPAVGGRRRDQPLLARPYRGWRSGPGAIPRQRTVPHQRTGDFRQCSGRLFSG